MVSYWPSEYIKGNNAFCVITNGQNDEIVFRKHYQKENWV